MRIDIGMRHMMLGCRVDVLACFQETVFLSVDLQCPLVRVCCVYSCVCNLFMSVGLIHVAC